MTEAEKAICFRVKEFREHIKWPQPDFASELGLTRDQLASIEYGRTPLKLDIGYQLCTFFDVSGEWLATGKGPRTPCNFQVASPPKNLLFSEHYKEYKSAKELAKTTPSVLSEPIIEPKLWLVRRILQIVDDRRNCSSDQELKDLCLAIENAARLTSVQFLKAKIKNKVRSSKSK